MTKITIESFHLVGFRAYLQRQTFHLCRDKTPLSLAIFAPNAKGKSSLVDAFEFYFSEDATLERLGIRATERAGRRALEHVNAQTKGVPSEVHFSFREGTDKFGDKRAVIPQGSSIPAAAQRVLENRTLPFVIRGHELRGFVEQQTSEDRYKEIAAWFGLDPLIDIQKNLRALRRQMKVKAESTTERHERLQDLARATGNTVKVWDEAAVCKWLNDEIVAKLDKMLTLATISETDTGYQVLKKRKESEEESLGLASLKRFLTQTETLYRYPAEEDEKPTGAIVEFGAAVTTHAAAVSKEAEERAKASQTVFNEVWTAAKAVFENNDVDLDACPVCDTKFPATPHGSRHDIRVKLDANLSDLTDYRNAEAILKISKDSLAQAFLSLIQSLKALTSSFNDTGYADKIKSIETYQLALATWKAGDGALDSADTIVELKALHEAISGEKKRIEAKQGEHTYANALKIADDLIKLRSNLGRIDRTKAELTKLHEQLNQQALAINKAIVEHTQKIMGKLKDHVNILYKEIQGGDVDAPPIHLKLPDEDDTNQQRIQLLIDFSSNRKGVVPSGYLSDSQIHTLALSLRLSAVSFFNTKVPIIVLDDVVTSYDADHRKNIAAMLAKHFGDFQIILVTHDERFFLLLQDHLPQNVWNFRRIIEIKPDFGPSFHDHRTPDEVIQAKLVAGESAANEIRQAEEEWLLDICRDFKVKVVIRAIERPYKYDRSELAGALASFLKNVGITPPEVPGIANPFLASLQKGDVENFGSHFSDNPNEGASVGDEKTRWEEFRFFRDQFACPSCGNKRFMKPEPLKYPVCKKCETPFAFNKK
ncbi:MAG: hypothetical protein Q7S69_01635 [Nitrosomonadaceae bacterium]|nr:hypothetical protein [Nitrosomonadaceae bacterium]